MMVGYFIWRFDMRGQPTAEKMLREHFEGNKHNSNKDVGHWQNHNLVKAIPISDVEFEFTLAELATKYPCPPILAQRDYYVTI